MITNFGLTNGEARMLLFLYHLQLKVIKEADRMADLAWYELHDLDEIVRSTSRRITYAEQIGKTEYRRAELAAVLPPADVAQVVEAANAIDFAQAFLVLSVLSDHLVFLDPDRKDDEPE